MHWLREVPVVVVAASVRALPRLQAEETIRTAHAVAAGRGLDPEKVGYDQWRAAAMGLEAPRPKAPTVADLRMIGLAVRKVPRGKRG